MKRGDVWIVITLLVVMGVHNGVAETYFTGDGGKGIRIAILTPQGESLATEMQYMPTLIQGVLVGDIQKYSAIAVLDRQNLETVLAETESGLYEGEDDYVQFGHIANVGYVLTGSVSTTLSGYALQFQIVSTTDGLTKASYAGICTIIDLENFTGIKKASHALLTQMGVILTAKAQEELARPDSQQNINAQVALAQGILAQNSGATAVEVLNYLYLAASYDTSLKEVGERLIVANNRLKTLSQPLTVVRTGNIRDDALAEIAAYKVEQENKRIDAENRQIWVQTLTECENYFTAFLKEAIIPWEFIYSTSLSQGKLNKVTETVDLQFDTFIHPLDIPPWVKAAEETVKAVRESLIATGKAQEWKLLSWPRVSVTQVSPFIKQARNVQVSAALLNSHGKTIGSAQSTFEAGWTCHFQSGSVAFVPYCAKDHRKGIFLGVPVNDITDTLTIHITHINGIEAETATMRGIVQITTETAYKHRIEEAVRHKQAAEAARKAQQAAEAQKKRTESIAKYHLVYLSSGTVSMDEGLVPVQGFFIGAYEVTQKEWIDVMGTNPSHFKGGTLPVEQVSWYDALIFCNRLSEREGLIPAYIFNQTGDGTSVTWNNKANGYRLPTEAEWEYAVRSGPKNQEDTYSGSSNVDTVGWYSRNSNHTTHAVGTKSPNAAGLYDMSGNVSEWCWDWSVQTTLFGQVNGFTVQVRGGSWNDSARALRSSRRTTQNPEERMSTLGFRIVRPAV